MVKKIPLHSLVLMIGPSGAGKTTLCKQKFKQYEILSIDDVREQLVGDFTRRDITDEAWDQLYLRAKTKLALGERVVVDGTHLRKHDRLKTANLGKTFGVPIFYIIVNRSIEEKTSTGGWRLQYPELIRSQDITFLENERDIMWGDGVAEVVDTRINDFTVIEKVSRDDFLNDIKTRGFNGLSVIGDVHGQYESFTQTIEWALRRNHFLMFLGDLIDYGPKSLETLELAYQHVTRGNAVNVIGNHELKIHKWLQTPHNNLKLSDGNKITISQFSNLGSEYQLFWKTKLNTLLNLGAYHWVMDKFIFSHGAASTNLYTIKDTQLHGKLGKFVIFGENKLDENGNYNGSKSYNWIKHIPANHTFVVGHDIRSKIMPLSVKNDNGGEALFLDTGSGKGGYLTCADIPFNSMKVTNFYRC